jgi:hypothetical protein
MPKDRKNGFVKGVKTLSLIAVFVSTFHADAFAQLAVVDPVNDPISIFQKWMDQADRAFTNACDGIGKAIQNLANAHAADVGNVNTRFSTTEVKTAVEVQEKNQMPDQYSYCKVSQAAAASADMAASMGALAQGLANVGPPLNGPQTAAQNIKNGLDLGLDPCTNSSDTEYAVNKSLKCTPKYGGAFERADRVVAVLYVGFQFPVPPGYKGPVNGVYAPLDPSIITSEKYMPFAAAYSACMHLANHMPPAPSAPNGTPNSSALAKDAYKDADLKGSSGKSECMMQLAERMQIPSGMSAKAYQDLHTDQATICTADVSIGYINADPQYTFAGGSTGTCQSDGRSTLQRMFDVAWRDQSASYHGVYLAGADRHDILAENRSLPQEKQAFFHYINEERAALYKAIVASDSAKNVFSSPLQAPVTQSQ